MLIYLSRRFLNRYKKDNKGATAVEFALVAIPFFTFIFGILEVGLLFASQTSLKNAIRETTRLVRTDVGDEGARNFTTAQFKQQLCGRSVFLPNCNENLVVTSQVQPVFAPLANLPADSTDSTVTSRGGDIVIVQVRYNWQVLGPVEWFFGGEHDGVLPVEQAMVFINEPA